MGECAGRGEESEVNALQPRRRLDSTHGRGAGPARRALTIAMLDGCRVEDSTRCAPSFGRVAEAGVR